MQLGRLGPSGYAVALGLGAVACGGMTDLNDYSASRDAGALYGGGGSSATVSSEGTGGLPGTAGAAGSRSLPRKPVPACGNGRLDPGEACDGLNVSGQTCASATMAARPNGALRCSASCTLDLSGCLGPFGMGGFTGGGGFPGNGGFFGAGGVYPARGAP